MGKQWKVSDFIFLGSKITADGDCSHEIKSHLLLGRKVMTNLDSILKSRDITLPTKVRLVKAMVFPVVMYGCESWTVKKAECQRIDGFELWCWRRLRIPWTARRSVLGVHWKDWCWSWNSSTLAMSWEELTHWKRLWCWEELWAGGKGDDRGWDGWMAPPTQWTWVWVNSGSWWWTGRRGVQQFTESQRVGHNWVTELNWTELWYTILVGESTIADKKAIMFGSAWYIFQEDVHEDVLYLVLLLTNTRAAELLKSLIITYQEKWTGLFVLVYAWMDWL